MLDIYSPEEFVCEKIRSILTRRGFKIRDLVDLFFLREKGYIPKELENQIIEKTRYMLKYEKYRTNIQRDISSMVQFGEEKNICLKPLPSDFYDFAKETIDYCDGIWNTG